MGSGIKFISQVLNQKGAPALYEDIIDNRPAATFEGRLFFATDVINGDTIFRDNGDGTWSALAGNAGGIATATNGLSIYDDTAVGLGGTLSQPDTVIIGDTRVWRTTSNENNQGFNLNFDGEIYQFGILENEAENRTYTRYQDGEILTENYDYADDIFFNIFHTIGEYEMVCRFLDENLYNYSPLIILAGQSTTLNVRKYDDINDGTATATFQMNFRRNEDNDALYCVYNFANVPVFADNATALAAGLIVGDIYRHDASSESGDQLRIVH
jgi:hypothetical protein